MADIEMFDGANTGMDCACILPLQLLDMTDNQQYIMLQSVTDALCQSRSFASIMLIETTCFSSTIYKLNQLMNGQPYHLTVSITFEMRYIVFFLFFFFIFLFSFFWFFFFLFISSSSSSSSSSASLSSPYFCYFFLLLFSFFFCTMVPVMLH